VPLRNPASGAEALIAESEEIGEAQIAGRSLKRLMKLSQGVPAGEILHTGYKK
jgi:hypothetical protein